MIKINVCHVGGHCCFGLLDATPNASYHINSIIFYITQLEQKAGDGKRLAVSLAGWLHAVTNIADNIYLPHCSLCPSSCSLVYYFVHTCVV